MGQRPENGKRGSAPPPLWLDVARLLALLAGIVNLAMGARYALWALASTDPATDVTDFRIFYESGVAWRAGHDLYSVANMNPPAFVMFFSPLTLLAAPQALVIWWVINFAALGVAGMLILRELSLRVTGTVILLGVWFAGTQAQIVLGQVGWVCMLLATLAWRDWRHRKMVRGALWLGLLIGLKPFFLPVLGVAFLRRQYKALGVACGVITATVVVGALGCGWTAYASWLRAGTKVNWYGVAYNLSLRGVVARLLEDAVGRPVWIAAAGVALGYATWRLWRYGFDADRDLSAGLLTSLLISPLGWVHYLPVALGPVLATLKGASLRWWSVICLASLFWPPGVGWAPQALVLERSSRNAIIGSVYTLGLVTLWWLCLQPRSGKDLVHVEGRTGESAPESAARTAQ